MQAAFSKQTASRPVVTSRRCAVTVQAALKPVDAATRRNVCGALFLLAASGMGAPIAEAIELKPATKIVINHTPSAEFKEAAKEWDIWTDKVESFPFTFDKNETVLMLEGRAIVTPDDPKFGPQVEVKAGDQATFPAGMTCKWETVEPIRKFFIYHD